MTDSAVVSRSNQPDFATLQWLAPPDCHRLRRKSIALGKSFLLAKEEFMKARDVGAERVGFEEELYPERFNEIYHPPLAFCVRGRRRDTGWATPGSGRNSPSHAIRNGHGGALVAPRGLVIVSGMARGVDTYAHRGALNGNG